MYSDIDRNKRISTLIIIGFTIFISLIVYAITYLSDWGEYALPFALIASIISTITTYYNCDKVVLASVRAREATKEEDLQLSNILDGLMIASGLEHKPKLYVIDSMQPNAFATGRDPEHSIICVTKGLIEKLNYHELEGVVAHELSHIKNYDIRLNAIVSTMVGFAVMLADISFRSLGRRSGSSNSEGNGNVVLIILGVLALILAPIASKLIQLAVSRRREYLADATAVSFTRNPDALISALERITQDPDELETANNATAHMFFASPFKESETFKLSALMSTHPPVEARIKAIRELE